MGENDKMLLPAVVYLSHGAGPLPLMGDQGHVEMVANLKMIASKLRKPSAIILISAHWEEKAPTVTHAANPVLFYDYYGFPEQTYQIKYPAPGAPDIADRLFSALADKGFEPVRDDERGFDHGMFVPLKIMYPEADIPCVQLSLVRGLDPAKHIQMGKALSDLLDENVLVIGSGFSFHNMRAFFTPDTDETRGMNDAFSNWLIDICFSRDIGEDERTGRLEAWEKAPFARYCHPREEHLLPLHVCYGVANRACCEYFTLEIFGKKANIFLW